MSDDRKLPGRAGSGEVEAFLKKVASTPAPRPEGGRGRLIFGMDATASREPTWDRACHIQAEMFQETKALGGLSVQLAYYRGFGEFEASGWADDPASLLKRMTGVSCLAGHTQIVKLLRHAIAETRKRKVNALVFVGDCLEEDIDDLGRYAGELGVLGLPVFIFHEGRDPLAAKAFKQVARLSGGAYCPFDSSSAQQLRDLLSAVAVFAAGGRRALKDYSGRKGGVVLKLTHQMR